MLYKANSSDASTPSELFVFCAVPTALCFVCGRVCYKPVVPLALRSQAAART
jgi:hypothetical protein